MMEGRKLCKSKNLDQVSTLGAEPEEREIEKERDSHPRRLFSIPPVGKVWQCGEDT